MAEKSQEATISISPATLYRLRLASNAEPEGEDLLDDLVLQIEEQVTDSFLRESGGFG